MIRLLLSHGADVCAPDAWGNTALHVAAMHGNEEACEELLLAGAPPDAVSEQRAWTPLMLAINHGHIALAERLISQGADTNFCDAREGWTPLLVACDQGLADFCLRLIRRGGRTDAVVKAGDSRGRSAIHLAAYFGDVDLMAVLLARGARIDQLPIGGGLGAIHWAVYNGHLPLLQFLLEQGANPDLRATGIYQLRSPLHYAVSDRREDMVQLLLEYHANPLLPDSEGISPLEMAINRLRETQESRIREIAEMLEAHV